MTFVIRSMSTTDYQPAYRSGGELIPAQKPEPYHVFLMRPEMRARAYWNRFTSDAMQFSTAEAAEAEIARLGLDRAQVAPIDADKIGFPAYWDSRTA